MSDEIKRSNELHETELEAAAGGVLGRETVDSHDPDICSTFTETDHRCLGLKTKTPCIHYSSTNDFQGGGGKATSHNKCLLGYYEKIVGWPNR